MPSIAAHIICAKLIASKLKINDDDFIKGNILPDIINIPDSHRKIKGTHYYIPNIEFFLEKLDLNNNLQLGYLTHLLLDKYFLEDYIDKIINENEVFYSHIIYKEYDILNSHLLKNFNIDVSKLPLNFSNDSIPINLVKYQNNLKFLKTIKKEEKTKYLDINHFSSFLINSSYKIAIIIQQLKSNHVRTDTKKEAKRKLTKY